MPQPFLQHAHKVRARFHSQWFDRTSSDSDPSTFTIDAFAPLYFSIQHLTETNAKAQRCIVLFVIRRHHVNHQTLTRQTIPIHLRHLPMIISHHTNPLLMRLHHDLERTTVIKAAYFREATRDEFSLVVGVVVKANEPAAVFLFLVLGVVFFCDLFILCFFGSVYGHSETGGGGKRGGYGMVHLLLLHWPVGG